jgi:RNA polymerase sigma-70 factor, ECF subfamily
MSDDDQTNELLQRAAAGEDSAGQRLLLRYRDRLRKMVGVRLDARLAARIDPSDVVQETLIDAAGLLPRYLPERPLPFYAWLRQIAVRRLDRLHRRHLHARKRSVGREQAMPQLSDQSVLQLASQIVAGGSSPSRQAIRAEQRRRVRTALTQLDERNREVLVLRFLEGLSLGDSADILGISEGAVSMRQLRALERLRELLIDD